jgi:hypothetical protein
MPEGEKSPGMYEAAVSAERRLARDVASRVFARWLEGSCASSSAVRVDETILLDVLGSLSADLMMRESHRGRAESEEMG